MTLTLNGSGNSATITDASGRTITVTYDGYDRIGSSNSLSDVNISNGPAKLILSDRNLPRRLMHE